MSEEKHIDGFERFLKEQADKNRMYPNDQIWRNINQQLHGNGRWPALTFAAILTFTIITAGLIFLKPNRDLFNDLRQTSFSRNNNGPATADATPSNNKPATVDIIVPRPANDKATIYSFNHPSAFVQHEPVSIVADQPVSSVGTETTAASSSVPDNGSITPVNLSIPSTAFEPVPMSGSNLSTDNTLHAALEIVRDNDDPAQPQEVSLNEEQQQATSAEQHADEVTNHELVQQVSNKYAAKKRTDRFQLQLYGGSSVSYRALTEPASYDHHFPYNSALNADPRRNPNALVNQNASIGFEIGTSLLYSINDRLRIKAGLQFNYRQYSIKAYNDAVSPAYIWLNNDNGTRDSMMVFSSIRNADGLQATTLHNRYFQLAVPVGIDWTFAQQRGFSLSMGASFQPTYQLNTDQYLITSDYKNYTQQPDMVRRLNFNMGAEVLANFKMAGLQWQVGPQLRYQMLPTQVNSYSVHEHLIDYGLKFGLIKQLK